MGTGLWLLGTVICVRPGSGCRQVACAIESGKRAPNLTSCQVIFNVRSLTTRSKLFRNAQNGLTVGELLLILLVAGVAVGGTVLAFLGMSGPQQQATPKPEAPLSSQPAESPQP